MSKIKPECCCLPTGPPCFLTGWAGDMFKGREVSRGPLPTKSQRGHWDWVKARPPVKAAVSKAEWPPMLLEGTLEAIEVKVLVTYQPRCSSWQRVDLVSDTHPHSLIVSWSVGVTRVVTSWAPSWPGLHGPHPKGDTIPFCNKRLPRAIDTCAG